MEDEHGTPALDLMRQVKAAFDPPNLFNSGKVSAVYGQGVRCQDDSNNAGKIAGNLQHHRVRDLPCPSSDPRRSRNGAWPGPKRGG